MPQLLRPEKRRGPGTPAKAPQHATNSVAPSVRRIEWAARLIESGKPFPRYGTPEWLALPDGPAKVAAVVVAAECWARDADELEGRLRAEVELSRAAFKADEDADYCARRDAHRESWTGTGFLPIPGQRAAIEAAWREWVNA